MAQPASPLIFFLTLKARLPGVDTTGGGWPRKPAASAGPEEEKSMPRQQKDVLTTGEVAELCNVAPRTVSKWFDSGQLHGYRIPGSRDRRIPLNALIRFMKHHQIPMDGLRSGRTRVLLVDGEADLTNAMTQALEEQTYYEVRAVNSAFAAGLECEKFRPHVMILDVHLNDGDNHEIKRILRETPDLQMTQLVATSGKLTDGQARHLLGSGFDGYLKKPFQTRQLIEAIEDVVPC
jgi:excisionase family DNA binding protein